eukprot:PhF_6_TR25854/c0_g1_i1/m.36543
MDSLASDADRLRLKGNELVKLQNWEGAIEVYTVALTLKPSAALYSNRSLCHYEIKEYRLAVLDAQQCIALDPNFLKGYYRMGKANMALEDYAGAITNLTKGVQLCTVLGGGGDGSSSAPAAVEMQSLLQRAQMLYVPRLRTNRLEWVQTSLQAVNTQYEGIVRTRLLLEEFETERRDTFNTLVDVGKNFYVRANVDNADVVVTHVGANVYLPLHRKEAIRCLKAQEQNLLIRYQHLQEYGASIPQL